MEISLHAPLALLDSGWQRDVLITLDGRQINGVAPGTPPPPGCTLLRGAAVPGLGNVHSHAFQRAMAGLTERRGRGDDDFWTWREVMYRFLAQMTADDIEAIATWAYIEMLEAGFTALGEFHYLHHAPDGSPYADPAETGGRIVAAAAEAGIGLTLLPCFYAHGGCGGKPPTAAQARFISSIDSFARLMEASATHLARLDGAVLGVAPHSLRAVDAHELALLVAQNAGGPIHIHAAEQVREVEECVAWSGARPVQWLLEHARVDERWCLIHCTHMTEAESQALARSGAVAGLCPITEANLGDGIFAAPTFVRAGGRFAVGSDSNVRISLAEELRTLEYGQRLRDRGRNRLAADAGSTGRYLFDAARRGGEQALRRPPGGLAAGRAADIVVLDTAHPALIGHNGDAILDAWLFAGGDGIVTDVFAGGRRVVEQGRHVRRERARSRFAAVMQRLAGAS